MYHDDHGIPHFHAYYVEHVGVFSVADFTTLEGSLPKRARKLVRKWWRRHQTELLEVWALCREGQVPFQIEGLE